MKQTCCLPENNDTQGIVKFSFSLKVNKRKRWITRTRNPPFFIVSVWKQCKLFYLISDRYSSYPSSFIFSSFNSIYSHKFLLTFINYSSSNFRTDKKASCGISTFPICLILFFPLFCFSSNFFFLVISPP